MSRSCAEVAALLDSRRQGLHDADKLELELHLSACPDCAQDAHALDAVLAVFDRAPTSLDPVRRERAIERALSAGGRTHVPALPQRRVAIAVGSLALVAASLLMWFSLAAPRPEVALVAKPPAVLVAKPPAALPEERPALLTPSPGDRLAFAHASVVSGKGAKLRFIVREHLLELAEGEIEVEVDPALHAPFSVRTPRFRVEVLGTGFRVTQTGVAVHHGVVRVVASDAAVATLHAGESWQLTSASNHEAPPRVEQAGGRDLQASLARARSLLARGSAHQAEALLSELSAKKRGDRAELETLRAECALVAGDLARAQQGYLRVSHRYRQLPAGENALFAAQKLARRRGDRVLARALAAQYLKRYPAGQFVQAIEPDAP